MKHTKLFSLVAALFLGAASVQAQSVPVAKKLPKLDLGVKLGANFAQIGGDGWEKTYQPGIVGGAFIGLHKHKIGLQAEALINTSHYTTKGVIDSVNKGDFRAIYFDIPVLFQYKLVGAKLAPKVWVMAGPQFSSLVSVKSLNNGSQAAEKTFKSSTVSAVLGAEVRYLKFTLGGRYILGMTDVNTSNVAAASAKNQSYQLYLGFRFI